jgi:hypothetical protein
MIYSPIASSADDDAVDLKKQGVTVSLDDEDDGFGRTQGYTFVFAIHFIYYLFYLLRIVFTDEVVDDRNLRNRERLQRKREREEIEQEMRRREKERGVCICVSVRIISCLIADGCIRSR